MRFVFTRYRGFDIIILLTGKRYIMALKKAGDYMLAERELNVNLLDQLDQLDLLERLEMADNEGGYEKIKQQLAFERKCIERKLYQKPPLVDNEH